MKKIATALILATASYLSAQTTYKPVYTGAPFLRIAPDARAGGLGDMGVATSADAFSQYWNASKYLFSRNYSGIGVSYTPYLSNITNDVFLLNGAYHTYLNPEKTSTFGASLYYFNLGEVQLTQLNVDNTVSSTGIAKPNEFALDVSYGLKLTTSYGMAVVARYIRSDLFNGLNDSQTKAANTFAVDVTGTYQGEPQTYKDFEGRMRVGFAIKNIGPKLDYSNSNNNSSYLPTNLGVGAGYDFKFDPDNKVTVGLEVNKLLVPSNQADGTQPNKSVIGAMFSSFGDAPGGTAEELKEFTYSASAEYNYSDSFAFRTGYFHESLEKGARQHLSVGAGFKYNSFGLDFSYLIPTSKINSALDNTLRFGLTWNFGENAEN